MAMSNVPEFTRIVRFIGNAARDRHDMYECLRAGAGRYIGPPAGTNTHSAEYLASVGFVGIYFDEVVRA